MTTETYCWNHGHEDTRRFRTNKNCRRYFSWSACDYDNWTCSSSKAVLSRQDYLNVLDDQLEGFKELEIREEGTEITEEAREEFFDSDTDKIPCDSMIVQVNDSDVYIIGGCYQSLLAREYY